MASNDLIDFMNSATRDIEAEYVRIQKRALEDPGTAGDQGEENWATLLRNWLPPTFQIVTKGRILSEKGIASPQVDIIILQPEYPKHLLDKKLYLAGGVLAIFECKITLKANHIADFIANSTSIRDNIPKKKGSPYKELNSGILFGLLAHSHSWKKPNSKPIEKINQKLWTEDYAKVTHPIQIPDILCIADLATWCSTKITFLGPKYIPDWHAFEELCGPNGSASSGYICQSKETTNQTDSFTPIGTMITHLLDKLAWEYPSLRPLASYFTLSQISGAGSGATRKWPITIYSDEIRTRIENGRLSTSKWDEWQMSFM